MSPRDKLDAKIMTWPNLSRQASAWKNNGDTIVFTNGCFDLLHYGHIDYLFRAAALGTRLVVALNSDDSVRRLKGPNRPIQLEKSRGLVMAALSCVDAVIFFDESTPEFLIAKLLPDVLVKGADYKVDEIAGAKQVLAAGGRVETIILSEGYSTSAIELRILKGR